MYMMRLYDAWHRSCTLDGSMVIRQHPAERPLAAPAAGGSGKAGAHQQLQLGDVAQLAPQLAVLHLRILQLDELVAARDVQRAAVLLFPATAARSLGWCDTGSRMQDASVTRSKAALP